MINTVYGFLQPPRGQQVEAADRYIYKGPAQLQTTVLCFSKLIWEAPNKIVVGIHLIAEMLSKNSYFSNLAKLQFKNTLFLTSDMKQRIRKREIQSIEIMNISSSIQCWVLVFCSTVLITFLALFSPKNCVEFYFYCWKPNSTNKQMYIAKHK